jgi:sn-glycerol 3-phosphate transport system substrate-binding protein
MTDITRRTALGAAIAIPAAAAMARTRACRRPGRDRSVFPGAGAGQARRQDEGADRALQRQQQRIKATAVYTGSYDDTNLKTRAAIKAGKPPAAVIMSANFVREYVINGDVDPFDPIIEKDGKTPAAFFDNFWPALKPNAVIDGKVYGIPYQNSTPLMYYSVDAFKDAGLDPDKPPGDLGGMARRGEEADQARRRPLGHQFSRHLRLLRLDHQRAL